MRWQRPPEVSNRAEMPQLWAQVSHEIVYKTPWQGWQLKCHCADKAVYSEIFYGNYRLFSRPRLGIGSFRKAWKSGQEGCQSNGIIVGKWNNKAITRRSPDWYSTGYHEHTCHMKISGFRGKVRDCLYGRYLSKSFLIYNMGFGK